MEEGGRAVLGGVWSPRGPPRRVVGRRCGGAAEQRRERRAVASVVSHARDWSREARTSAPDLRLCLPRSAVPAPRLPHGHWRAAPAGGPGLLLRGAPTRCAPRAPPAAIALLGLTEKEKTNFSFL